MQSAWSTGSDSAKVEAVGSKLDELVGRMCGRGKGLWPDGVASRQSRRSRTARSTIGEQERTRRCHRCRKAVRRDGAGRLIFRAGTARCRGSARRDRAGDARRSGAPMLWVSKSHEARGRVAEEGHEVSASSVKRAAPDTRLQSASNRKATRARSIPTAMRNSSTSTPRPSRAGHGQPVISVDTRRKS